MFTKKDLEIGEIYEVYDSKGRRVTLRLEEIAHVEGPNPRDEFVCRSLATRRPTRIQDVRQFIKLAEEESDA